MNFHAQISPVVTAFFAVATGLFATPAISQVQNTETVTQPFMRVLPVYPFEALVRNIEAKISMQTQLDNDCKVKSMRVLSNSAKAYQSEFEDAVSKAIGKWQLTCDAATKNTTLDQEYSFVISDRVASERDPSQSLLFKKMERPAPAYPRNALEAGAEANLLFWLPVSKDCQVGTPQLVYSFSPKVSLTGSNVQTTFSKAFELAASDSLKKWRFKEPCGLDQPTLLQQEIRFTVEDSSIRRYRQKDVMQLQQFLSLIKADESYRKQISTVGGVCPAVVGLTPLKPYKGNLIKLISPEQGTISPVLGEWLQNLELLDVYKMSFLGDYLVVKLPCADIDLR
jgi:hypothetical protein